MDGGGDEDDAAPAPGGEDGRLTLTSQATGLDPDVTRAALDAFVRERGDENRTRETRAGRGDARGGRARRGEAGLKLAARRE